MERQLPQGQCASLVIDWPGSHSSARKSVGGCNRPDRESFRKVSASLSPSRSPVHPDMRPSSMLRDRSASSACRSDPGSIAVSSDVDPPNFNFPSRSIRPARDHFYRVVTAPPYDHTRQRDLARRATHARLLPHFRNFVFRPRRRASRIVSPSTPSAEQRRRARLTSPMDSGSSWLRNGSCVAAFEGFEGNMSAVEKLRSRVGASSARVCSDEG